MPQTNEITQLNPFDQIKFNKWIKDNNIKDLDDPETHYDYRGYWKDIVSKGNSETQINSEDHKLHYPDTYKQHGHPTFSVESKYSTGPNDGGSWNGNTFIPSKSTVENKMPSSNNGLMKAADFAAKLREKLPELAEFNDTQIINKILELRPDLTDKVENPLSGDIVAAKEQARTLEKADRDKDFTRSVMSALPATGVILGGTTGPLGSALGAGIGRGAMDLGNQFLGLDNSSPLEKAKNIGVDTGIAALTPGAMEFVKNPIQSSRIGAKMLSGLEDSFIPNRLKPFIKPPFLEDFANRGKPKFDPLVRPTNMNVPSSTVSETVESSPQTKRSIMYKYGKYIDKNTGEEIPMTKNTVNTSSMKFNPKGQKGMTGSGMTFDDVINSLMKSSD